MCLGLPGRIVAFTGNDFDRSAQVDFGSQVKLVNVITLPDAAVGEWIVVHSGFAVRRLTDDEAAEAVRHFERSHGRGFTLPPHD